MAYDIKIPLKIALFTVATAYLIVYFVWLMNEFKKGRRDREFIAIAVLHIIIMVGGLLLTGFATEFL
jgi:hypothetical protein